MYLSDIRSTKLFFGRSFPTFKSDHPYHSPFGIFFDDAIACRPKPGINAGSFHFPFHNYTCYLYSLLKNWTCPDNTLLIWFILIRPTIPTLNPRYKLKLCSIRSNLTPGQKYKIIKTFIDFDQIVHPVDEAWIFIETNFLPYEDGLTLHVLKGLKTTYRLEVDKRKPRKYNWETSKEFYSSLLKKI